MCEKNLYKSLRNIVVKIIVRDDNDTINGKTEDVDMNINVQLPVQQRSECGCGLVVRPERRHAQPQPCAQPQRPPLAAHRAHRAHGASSWRPLAHHWYETD